MLVIVAFHEGTKNTVGEFFNPGYDCADVLNKRQDSEDGFYWITLKGPNLYKVKHLVYSTQGFW
jgi:hypothetical protein